MKMSQETNARIIWCIIHFAITVWVITKFSFNFVTMFGSFLFSIFLGIIVHKIIEEHYKK